MKRETVLAIRRIVLGISAGAFVSLIILVAMESAGALDDPIRHAFYAMRSEALTVVITCITYLSDKVVIIAMCIILLIIPWTRLRFGVPLSAGALALTIINHLIKARVERPRPEVLHLVEEGGFSFPSGHSSNSFFFYGLAIYLVRTQVENRTVANVLTVVFALLMILIGPTRIYLGVHYPTDVLGGWCLGLVAVIVEVEILEYLRLKKESAATLE